MRVSVILFSAFFTFISCTKKATGQVNDTVQTAVQTLELPPPYATKSTYNFSKVIGWPDGKKPIAPAGFTVTKYVNSIRSARWIYVLPNGDVLVSQANSEDKGIIKVGAAIVGANKSGNRSDSPNQITLLRDTNQDGLPDLRVVFLSGLQQPHGMLVVGDKFYVAETNGITVYPFKVGDLNIKEPGKKILSLPAGGYNNHWTRNLLLSKDGKKIYVSVGSASNIGEHGMEEEIRRAGILEINTDGTGEKIFASGIRNPVGMDWEPISGKLWTAVNERDKLGDDLVPDYATSVQEGGFYGWPYSYFGKNLDPRFDEKTQRMDLVEKALVPDVALGAHTASLGLAFNTYSSFPEKYKNGMFIGQHGSWNRSEFSGYKVVFVPFKDGKPSGPPEDFLTGFIHDTKTKEVYGRPVCVTFLRDGSMLVSDDAANVIWRVCYNQ
jgi:glucose/arabinose dehydrogenase